jgi:protein O-mannosyl-transferase
MKRIATHLGLGALVLLALAPALAAGFVWDDGPLILDNPAVKNPRLLPQLLTSSFWQTGDRDDRFRSFFRPLVSMSYAADYAVWGPKALGFHLTNLLLHFGCVLLVYRIATREKIPPAAAFCAAALFAVHPVHVESVAWICGRTDVIATLLVLAAFLVHRRAEEGQALRWLAAGLLFLPALFAKEVAATLPAIVALDRWLRTEGEPRRIGRALSAALPFAFALAVYVGVRSIVLRGGAELLHLGPVEWAATAAFVAARYLTLLVLPVSLDAHYPYAALDGFHDPLAIVGLLMVAIVAAAAVVLFRRSRADAFWLLWIPITLAPVMLFGRFGDVLMADRFLYLPSVGLAILFGRGCALVASFSPVRRAVPIAACALAICALAWTSADRTQVWNDDITLFSDMARTSPSSALVHANLGMALYRHDQPAAAIEELRLALHLVPSFAMAHNDLGAALERMGDNTGAEDHYRAALRQAPGLVSAEANLAHLLVESGRGEEGVRRLRRLVDKRPNSPDVLFAAGDAAKEIGAYEEALGYVERLLRVEPRNARAFYLRGQIQLDQGRQAEAVASMRRFLELYSKPGPHVDAARRVVAGEPVSRL